LLDERGSDLPGEMGVPAGFVGECVENRKPGRGKPQREPCRCLRLLLDERKRALKELGLSGTARLTRRQALAAAGRNGPVIRHRVGVLAKPHSRDTPADRLALSQNQLPQRVAHVPLRRFDVIAALDASADLFDSDPRYLLERFLRELKRALDDLGEMLITWLCRGHDAYNSTPAHYAHQECCTAGDPLR
jgi:hypothetical protein